MQDLWSICVHEIGEPRQKDIISQQLSHEFVRVREQLLRPVKDLPIGFGRRVQKLKEKISEHVGEYLQSEQVMEEDITNAERDVRVKQAEIKEIERKFTAEIEFKGAELQQALKAEKEAREAKEGLSRGREAAILFGEIMSNAETSMQAMADELEEFNHLFEEAEEDKKKKTLAEILKRARTRQSESEGGGTPIPPSVERKKPVPKKLPEAQKLKMMKREEERKFNEDTMGS